MRFLRSAFAVAATFVSGIALAGPDKVAYPEGYETKFVNYLSVDRGDPTQIAELFASPKAVEGLKADGKLPQGTVLVMEIHNAKLDEAKNPVIGANGRRIKDGLKSIVVMLKCSGCGADAPEAIRNGDWEFAAFSPKDKSLVQRDYKPCFECHKPLDSQDFVQSWDKLPRK